MKVQMSRWKGMDNDISDDQQDIARGRGMVDSKFQGGFGLGGTQVRLAERTPSGCRWSARPDSFAFVVFPATGFVSRTPQGSGVTRDRGDRADSVRSAPIANATLKRTERRRRLPP
jgi:hypothetical protein